MFCKGGQSEEILGDMVSWRENNGHIATKLNPWDGKNYKEESLREQVAHFCYEDFWIKGRKRSLVIFFTCVSSYF